MRVVGLWGWANTVPGQHGAGLRWAGPTRVGPMLATQSRKFEIISNKMRILAISILKLRPELNVVAFCTYAVKISDLKVVPFMVYTYNIQGWHDGTRCQQTMLVKFP